MSAHRLQTRWGDLDALGHVGHTAVFEYLEAGRDAFLKTHGIARNEYVVGRCSVTFQREIKPSVEAVTVECETRDLGSSSVTTSERILDEAGDVLVEAEFGIVLWDPAARGSRPMTAEQRASLQKEVA